MRKHPIRRILLSSAATVSGVVLLLALKAPSLPGGAPAQAAPPPAAATGAPPAGGAEGGRAGGAARTVTGETVRTEYGPVQARITVSGGRITAASAVRTPSSSARSKALAASAVPRLGQRAVAAQSAEIDTVSGATYTSEGYIRSLQSALDSAGV